jgi:lipopolysaccharide transport system permease protein
MTNDVSGSSAAAYSEQWDSIIGPQKGKFSLNLKEVWRYKDLLMLFVKKDIITVYKQTVLGPIWFLLQPIMTTVIFTFIFGGVAKIQTDDIPKGIFYMGSLTMWNYFADTLNVTSKTFSDNASVFGKVYFPRIILPISKVLSGFVKLCIQFSIFMVMWVYYTFVTHQIHPNMTLLLFPVLLLTLSLLSLGFGIIVTSLTTKYRDLAFLIGFGVQLWQYATPIIYPLSGQSPRTQFWLLLNPLTSIIEAFKYGFLGKGVFSPGWLCYSIVFTLVTLLSGIFVFNRVEKKFIDTV